MKRVEMIYVLIAALCAAGIVSATNASTLADQRIYLYLYWLVRIAIESGLFVAFRSLLETTGMFARQQGQLLAASYFVSLVPFVLAATALDIVLGFPELGLASTGFAGDSFLREFLFEVAYLADDHLFVCLLLSLPRFLAVWDLQETRTASAVADPQEHSTQADENILPTLEPPLSGTLIRVEAQEHYVLISSTEEQRMVLGRFTDIIATLPSSLGLKVHRSHWVARATIAETFTEKRNLKLRLTNGDIVPVSRRYRDTVLEAVAKPV